MHSGKTYINDAAANRRGTVQYLFMSVCAYILKKEVYAKSSVNFLREASKEMQSPKCHVDAPA